jgi:hypothetical protein
MILLLLLSLAPEPAGGVTEDWGGELPVSSTVALMRMLVSVPLLNRRRIGSLQSRNESSDAELVVDGVAVFDGPLELGETTGGGDVGDDGSSSRFHRSDGSLMDV